MAGFLGYSDLEIWFKREKSSHPNSGTLREAPFQPIRVQITQSWEPTAFHNHSMIVGQSREYSRRGLKTLDQLQPVSVFWRLLPGGNPNKPKDSAENGYFGFSFWLTSLNWPYHIYRSGKFNGRGVSDHLLFATHFLHKHGRPQDDFFERDGSRFPALTLSH